MYFVTHADELKNVAGSEKFWDLLAKPLEVWVVTGGLGAYAHKTLGCLLESTAHGYGWPSHSQFGEQRLHDKHLNEYIDHWNGPQECEQGEQTIITLRHLGARNTI